MPRHTGPTADVTAKARYYKCYIGPQTFSRLGHLDPYKFQRNKEKFDFELELGILSPFGNPWNDPFTWSPILLATGDPVGATGHLIWSAFP